MRGEGREGGGEGRDREEGGGRERGREGGGEGRDRGKWEGRRGRVTLSHPYQ